MSVLYGETGERPVRVRRREARENCHPYFAAASKGQVIGFAEKAG